MDVGLIDSWLVTLVRQGGSEVRLQAGRCPTMQLAGHIRPLQPWALDVGDVLSAAALVTPEPRMREFRDTGVTSFSFWFGDQARMHVAAVCVGGEVSLVLRRYAEF